LKKEKRRGKKEKERNNEDGRDCAREKECYRLMVIGEYQVSLFTREDDF
jgi:hypothetical protein